MMDVTYLKFEHSNAVEVLVIGTERVNCHERYFGPCEVEEEEHARNDGQITGEDFDHQFFFVEGTAKNGYHCVAVQSDGYSLGH